MQGNNLTNILLSLILVTLLAILTFAILIWQEVQEANDNAFQYFTVEVIDGCN